MKENRKENIKYMINGLILLIGMPAIPVLFSVVQKHSVEQLLQIGILTLIGTGCMLLDYFWKQGPYHNSLNEGQKLDPTVYTGVLLTCCVIACLMPLLPANGWPFLSIALLLFLLSDALQTLLSVTVLLMIACLMKQTGMEVLICYLFCTVVVIALFDKLDKRYRIGIPVFLSLCAQLVVATANLMLFTDLPMNIETFVVPVISLFVNLILMIVILKSFSAMVVHRYRDRYMTINDTEFEILVRIKAEKPKSYFLAIHTSYLTDKLATRFELDKDSVKTASYYWKLCEDQNGRANQKLLEALQTDYHFPPKAMELLYELTDKKTRLASREAIAVYMANRVIEQISALFLKDNKQEIPYKQLMEQIFHEKQEQGFFEQCQFTMKDLTNMKKVFVEEALYYELLR